MSSEQCGGEAVLYQNAISAKSHFVILSEAKDLVFTYSYEILRSLRSLRMTKPGTFAEVSKSDQTGNLVIVELAFP